MSLQLTNGQKARGGVGSSGRVGSGKNGRVALAGSGSGRETVWAPSVRQMVPGNRSAGLERARHKQEYGLDVQHTSNTHPTYVQHTSNITSNIAQVLSLFLRPGYVLRTPRDIS